MKTNTPAEQAVVGAALLGNPLGILNLTDDDFTDRRHLIIATAIRDYVRKHPGQEYDATIIAGELGRSGQLDRDAGGFGYMMKITETIIGGLALAYACDVRECTIVRMTAAAAARLARMMESEESNDAVVHADALAIHRAELDALPESLENIPEQRLATIADLLNEEFTHDWLVEDLIERTERIVMVAGEGAGKSVFATQAAICVSAGLHPWTGERVCEPARVLLIDAENGRAQTQRRYKWVGDQATKASPGWAHRIMHEIHPEGLDLPGKDRAWFHRVCAQASPDLIILGPAYKLSHGNPQLDSDMLALFSILDEVRIKHNAALLIETHAGHAKDSEGSRVIRPYGSSVWLRWPEVGLGFSRGPGDVGDVHPNELAVGHWRGTREDRKWPDLIEHGKAPRLPWAPVSSDFMTTVARKAISR